MIVSDLRNSIIFDTVMFTFDPWKLFGLTPTSTVHEARRAYYELAMIMHPDKGGDAEDMRNLHQAFKWIYNQLEGATFPITIDDPTKTPAIEAVIGMDRPSLEKCYDTIKTTDDERTRVMALDWMKYIVEKDLMMGKDLRPIQEYLLESIKTVSEAQNEMYTASIPDGYGAVMDTNEDMDICVNMDTAYSVIAETETLISPRKNKTNFSKELAVYQEPICPTDFFVAKNPVHIPEKTDDYSNEITGLTMTDYALAHSKHVISDTQAYEAEKEEMKLIRMMEAEKLI